MKKLTLRESAQNLMNSIGLTHDKRPSNSETNPTSSRAIGQGISPSLSRKPKPLLVRTTVCKTTFHTFHRMVENRVNTGLGIAGPRIEVNLQKVVRKSGAESFQLFANYRGYTFMRIAEGKSLILILDGEGHTLTGTGSGEDRYALSKEAHEFAMYSITKEDIARLATTESGRIKLIGEEKTYECDFTEENLEQFRLFAVAYL